MKTFTIIGGVNGAGKSSLSGVLQSERNDLGPIINVDKMALEENLSPVEAGKQAVVLIKRYLNKGIAFTQETTLSGLKTLVTVRRAKRRGYFIRLYYVGLETVEDSLVRIRMRAENGGHYVPENDVVRRFNKRYDSLMRILPYCDEATFFDNCNGFVEVAHYEDRVLKFTSAYRPRWLVDLCGYIEKSNETPAE